LAGGFTQDRPIMFRMDHSERRSLDFGPNQDLNANGIDLNRLRRNLAMSLEERIARNRLAAALILECRRAAESARVRETDPIS